MNNTKFKKWKKRLNKKRGYMGWVLICLFLIHRGLGPIRGK